MSIIPEGHSLFIVDLEYTVPMEQIQAVLEPHLEFVRAAYGQGRFLASGAKVPRTGGVIVMHAKSLSEAEEYLAADPFVTANVASYSYTEFLPSNLHDALK
ncbi:YciI family protein [Thalassobius sp. S69A]|uniref:YciI family protein n=1 Tax=unclassified Thalassovita TaxID=2619711 RepID=UPI000C0F70AA|nr:hypothetical protein [Paracoccaceae bacterium]MBT24896.1 hypothetical protein [Paracoccaceae bacterium]|tara:strand:- start:181 stop:483 length:303 start_codon:yes stop_codon:yes gene_type:complete